MPLMALGGSFTAVFPPPSPPSSRSVTLPETSQISREIGAAPLDHRPLAPSARHALPPACAGGSRHEPASNVSVPADIQGGDAVSEETPSGLNDALSARTAYLNEIFNDSHVDLLVNPPRGVPPVPWNILEGDCLEILKTVPTGSARLAFADPPFNIGIDYGNGHNDKLSPRDYLDWCRRWMEAIPRILTDDGSAWVLSEPRWGGRFQCMLEDVGLHYRDTIIWHETFGVYCESKYGRDHRPLFRFTVDPKRQVFHPERVPSARQTIYNDRRANPKGRVPSNVWTISRVCGTFRERMEGFPTQLPVALLKRVVECASDPGDLIIDPFSGSGTTGEVAIQLKRRYIGVERSAEFVGRSRERLTTVQGKLVHVQNDVK
jgi:site-specific DNA-methyltransferase (adenine-specific)